LKVNSGCLVTVDIDNSYDFFAYQGYGKDFIWWEKLKPRQGIVGHVVLTGSLYNCPDVSNCEFYASLSPSTRSQLTIPMVGKERVIAVLTLESNKINCLLPK